MKLRLPQILADFDAPQCPEVNRPAFCSSHEKPPRLPGGVVRQQGQACGTYRVALENPRGYVSADFSTFFPHEERTRLGLIRLPTPFLEQSFFKEFG